jgi:hypothetical protein
MFGNDNATTGQGYGTINVEGTGLGSPLQQVLMADSIEPGSDPSYELCKIIYTYHPLGAKMVDRPIKMAMSQKRTITVQGSPEEMVKDAFNREWENLGCDQLIANTMRLSRIYGIASLVYGVEGEETDRPAELKDLYAKKIYFNVLDPLNTAGSLVLNQNPTAVDFQKRGDITVAGKTFHRSRACVIMNEEPIYIEFTTSAFGFVGRSVYQRALFPLKTFVQSMQTDDMVTRKAGLLIAKMKQVGSITDKLMYAMGGVKRRLLQQAKTDNVLSISTEESVETLNLQNADTAMVVARKNVLENIAAAADMPAQILNNETFAEGFGEGTEDAKEVVRYCHGVRNDMQPLYDFLDKLVRYRAWNRDFYARVQAEFPEYKEVEYETAFFQWYNNFETTWPSLMEEPESKKLESQEKKLKALTELLVVLMPTVDPGNKARLIEWAMDNYNELKLLFPQPMLLDLEELQEYLANLPQDEAVGDPKDLRL